MESAILMNVLDKSKQKELNTEYEASGLTIKEFCTRQGISYERFKSYRQLELKKQRRGKFVPLTVSEVKSSAVKQEVRLEFPSGINITIRN